MRGLTWDIRLLRHTVKILDVVTEKDRGVTGHGGMSYLTEGEGGRYFECEG